MAEDVISEVIDEVAAEAEKLFPPKPGGMVDRHRQAKAQREELQRERENEHERIEEQPYKAVKVAQLAPTVIATNVVTIQPGATGLILPYSPYRYRAYLSIDTAASKVILAKDASAALGGTGFTYATGVPLQVGSRAQLWGFNPGGSPIAVSTLAEIYGPEILS